MSAPGVNYQRDFFEMRMDSSWKGRAKDTSSIISQQFQFDVGLLPIGETTQIFMSS